MRTTLLLLALAGCSHHSAAPAAEPAPVAKAPRNAHDAKLDKFRKPDQFLAFAQVKAGMHVADLGAGTGYTSQLMAEAVGPSGSVIAQDSPHWAGDWMTKAWDARMKQSIMANTTHVMRDWADPIPPEAHDLDMVTFFAAYHDVIAEKDDPEKLDAAVFKALKHGGVFIVIDNSAKAGSGGAACEPLHRVDEQLVKEQVQKAGFQLAGESDYLRNPSDPRDWNADPDKDPRTHTQDLFALRFVKP